MASSEVEVWHALLAGRIAAGSSRARYAACLLQRHAAGHALPVFDLPWPLPTAEHWHLAAKQLDALLTLGIHCVPVWQLPKHLLSVTPLAPALFVRGDAALLQQTDAVAVVGSRRASSSCVAWAYQCAARWAAQGTLIVSGGAMGIDSAAHAGALSAGAPTLAYVGSAIDALYPRLNAPLYQHMLQQGGAVASEHPPMAQTFKSSHAARNRLIAAHGSALVVVEAAEASGTMSAVRYAHALGSAICLAPPEAGGQRSGIAAVAQLGWDTPVQDWGRAPLPQ